MSDIVDYCQVCQKPFNSRKSAEDHYQSYDHKKREEAIKQGLSQHPFFCQICNCLCNSLQTFLEHNSSRSHSERVRRSEGYSCASDIKEEAIETGQEYCFDEGAQRGNCFACDIQLTSLAHAKQHLAGQKHLKKRLAYSGAVATPNGSFAAPSSPNVHFAAPSSPDVLTDDLTCAACNISVTCMDNMRQHLESEKHKKKASLFGDNSPISNSSNEHPLSSHLESQIHAPGSNIVSVDQIKSLMSGNSWPGLDSDEDDKLNNDENTFCEVCQVAFTGPASARQHYSSEKHKKRTMMPKTNFQRFGMESENLTHARKLLSNVGQDSNIHSTYKISPDLPRHQALSNPTSDFPEYKFNGSTGFCFLCDIQLTSIAHKEQHINGAKHVKAAMKRKSTPVFRLGQGLGQPLANSQTNRPQQNDPETYIFENGRGRCFACDIELTSASHAQQHLAGTKHVKATQRLKAANTGHEYPLSCEVCAISISGQEPAQQHFTSKKHQQKVAMKMALAGGSSGNQWAINPINPLDRTEWVWCEVCECPLNTMEQLRAHKQTPKHLAKKASREIQASNSEASSINSQEIDQLMGQLELDSVNNGSVQELEIIERKMQKLQERKEAILLRKTKKGIPVSVERPVDPNRSVGNASQNDNTTKNPVNSYHDMLQRLTITSNQGNYFQYGGIYNDGPPSQMKQDQTPKNQPDLDTDSSLPNYLPKTRMDQFRPFQGQGLLPDDNSTTFSDSEEEFDNDDSAKLFGDGTQVFEKKVKKSSHLKNHQSKNSKITFGNDSKDDVESEDFQFNDEVSDLMSLHSTKSEKERKLAELKQISHDPQDVASLAESSFERHSQRSFQSGSTIQKSQRSPFHKFYCQICQVNCNTEKALIDHKNGVHHLQTISKMKAPRIPYPPIVKSFKPGEISSSELTVSAPRSYQVELFWKAMLSDHVCFLPTGTGKTLVSVMVISAMLKNNPARPVLFLVDKTLLVIQQALYIIKELGKKIYERPRPIDEIYLDFESRELKIAVLSGGISKLEKIPLWRHDVIVTTAAFCDNLICQEVINWRDFSLVVMDEVHHCFKRHPYATLINTSHKVLDVQERPKLLGLTASPAGCDTVPKTVEMLKTLLLNLGDVKIGITEGRREMQQLDEFQSTAHLQILCQPITQEEEEFEIQLKVHLFHCYRKMTELCGNKTIVPGFPTCENDVSKFESLAKKLDDDAQHTFSYIVDFMDAKKVEHKVGVNLLRIHIKKILQAISDMETGSLTFAMPELQKLMETKDITKDYEIPCNDLIQCIQTYINSKQLPGRITAENTLQSAAFRELINSLKNPTYINFSEKSAMALVLVQMRTSAKKLSKLLQSTLTNLKVTHLVGHGKGSDSGMRVQKQKRTLEGIKANRYDIVVATSVAEEGVDIPACQLVVSLNPPSNVTALVQIRGRARKHGSHFVIICNTEEKREKINSLILKEKNMIKAARSISQSQSH